MKSVLQSRVFVSEVGVSERTCDSPPQHTCSCSTCHSRVTSPVYNSSHRASNGKSYHVHVVLYWNFGVKGKGTQLTFLFSNFLSKKKKAVAYAYLLQVLENFILSDKLLVETTYVLTTYISFFTVCSYRHSPQSASHSNSNGPCYLNTHEIHICTNPRCVPPGENRGYRSDNQEGRKLHRFRSAENCVVSDYHVRGENRGHHSLSRNWSTDKIPPTIPPKQLKHNMYIHASKCAVAQNGGPHGKYPPPQDV